MKYALRCFLSLVVLAGSTVWAQPTPPYKLRHGDALTVAVWREEALRMEVRVLPDGSITFPLAGRVEVVGLTTPQAEELITRKIKTYMPYA